MDTPEIKEVKNPLPGQFTIRLGKNDLEFVNENLDIIRDGNDEMPRSQIITTAFTLAVQKTAPKPVEVEKTIEVDNPVQLQRIQELEGQLEGVQNLVDENKIILDQIKPGSIVLNLDPKDHKYFWGVLQLTIKSGFAKTYEELLNKMFEVYHARGEFKFNEEDIVYLNTLSYDGPGENPEAGAGE